MIFDIILIIIFALAILRGWQKGFIRMAFGAVSLILAIIISFCFRTPIANFAMTLPFAQKISDAISNTASDAAGEWSNLSFVSDAMNTQVSSLTYIIVQILSVCAVLLIVFILLRILSGFLTGFMRLVHLTFLNRIAGMAIGVVNGYILIFLVTMGCFAVSVFVPWLGAAMSASFLANNLPNPISLFMNLF
ncbi:MAG: CvpA family protein [Clostridiales bacterium]|jgi:uncharacterized membrane protein required for colicin V production|nr:CvpA family protein [Clostridiales bacterium]